MAVKETVPPTGPSPDSGDTETVTTGAAETWTVAVAFRVGSATLVATTWKVPVPDGAGVPAHAIDAPSGGSFLDRPGDPRSTGRLRSRRPAR
jgi:hypothetical protein